MSPESIARAQLEGLGALAAERLAAARRGDWQSLAVLEIQRREALDAIAPQDLAALAAMAPEALGAMRQELTERDRLIECALRKALTARAGAVAEAQVQQRAERGYRKGSPASS